MSVKFQGDMLKFYDSIPDLYLPQITTLNGVAEIKVHNEPIRFALLQGYNSISI